MFVCVLTVQLQHTGGSNIIEWIFSLNEDADFEFWILQHDNIMGSRVLNPPKMQGSNLSF